MTEDLKAVIEGLERVEEGSRELDARIRMLVAGDFTYCDFETGCYCGDSDCGDPGCGKPLGMMDERTSYPSDWREDDRLPAYTTSIDAAMTLVPARWHIRIYDWHDTRSAQVELFGIDEDGEEIVDVDGNELWIKVHHGKIKDRTQRICNALCIAALRAIKENHNVHP